MIFRLFVFLRKFYPKWCFVTANKFSAVNVFKALFYFSDCIYFRGTLYRYDWSQLDLTYISLYRTSTIYMHIIMNVVVKMSWSTLMQWLLTIEEKHELILCFATVVKCCFVFSKTFDHSRFPSWYTWLWWLSVIVVILRIGYYVERTVIANNRVP